MATCSRPSRTGEPLAACDLRPRPVFGWGCDGWERIRRAPSRECRKELTPAALVPLSERSRRRSLVAAGSLLLFNRWGSEQRGRHDTERPEEIFGS
jgi:hypothetical protein